MRYLRAKAKAKAQAGAPPKATALRADSRRQPAVADPGR